VILQQTMFQLASQAGATVPDAFGASPKVRDRNGEFPSASGLSGGLGRGIGPRFMSPNDQLVILDWRRSILFFVRVGRNHEVPCA